MAHKELTTATAWLDAGQDVVLAVVASTWGSAPRRAGSLMVVRNDTVFEGSVSGGCVEGAVIGEATAMLEAKDGTPVYKELTFAVASEDAWDVGLACGGEITIWLFRLGSNTLPALREILDYMSVGKSSALVFNKADGAVSAQPLSGKPGKPQPSADHTRHIIPIIAPLSIVVIGAVHIAQHLAAIAAECDFSVTIVDPRAVFRENRGFSGATLIDEWPDKYFRRCPATASTAIVTLTHDPKLDDAALVETLTSDAIYIGCLGSRKTHAARLERIQQHGFDATTLDKIDAPVGLDIKAATPAEIAVSIMGKIIQTVRTP